MLPVDQAEALILNTVQAFDRPEEIETVDLFAASGRILAETAVSSLDFPHWDNSAMDGYAVRFDDVKAAQTENPVSLEVVEEIPAGYQPTKTIQPGQAARIFTGAVMPAGADTIVIQEDTQALDDRVQVLAAPSKQGAFVRHQASFYQAGTPLLSPGICLQAAEIAVLAAAQCDRIQVYRRPKVAILSTGNELVTPDQPLKPGQIVDSNQYALASLVQQAGAIPVPLGIVPDRPKALKGAIAQACAQADVILSTGGVSVGDYDYVDRILNDLGATLHIRSVAIKPGKPLTFATIPAAASNQRPSLYFGLPGNPVSSLVSFWRFVQPALRKLSGRSENWLPSFISVPTQTDLRAGGQRETYLWGKLSLENGRYTFDLASGSHSSGNLVNLASCNALAIVPVGQRHISAGTEVQVMQVR